MKLFNLDSPLMVFLTKVANLMILNILVLICCIPVVTVGPAVTAMYYVTIKMAKGEDPYIAKNFFKSFKENFKQATIIWLVMLAIIVVIGGDWFVITKLMQGTAATVMKVVLTIITVFIVMTGLYVFPVLSRFENSIKHTVKNAFLMSLLSLPKSIMIFLMHLLPVVLVMISLQSIPFIFLLGAPTIAYLCSMLYVRVFKRFEPEEEDVLGDPEELAPLSFIVEEQMAKQAELEAAEKEKESENI